MRFNEGRRRRLIFDVRYEPKGMIGDPCTYCGVVSDTMDHVPPVSFVARMAELDPDILTRLYKHPACRECNSILGATLIFKVLDRRAHVRDRLMRKYKKYIQMPKWDEDELEELDESFARYIRNSSKYAEWIKKRVAWKR